LTKPPSLLLGGILTCGVSPSPFLSDLPSMPEEKMPLIRASRQRLSDGSELTHCWRPNRRDRILSKWLPSRRCYANGMPKRNGGAGMLLLVVAGIVQPQVDGADPLCNFVFLRSRQFMKVR